MRILFVDDDPAILELYGIILENLFENLNLEKASNPTEAMALLTNESNNYDLVISDFDMPPHGTGEEVYKTFKSLNRSGNFLLFTSRHKSELTFLNDPEFETSKYNYIQKSCPPKEWKIKIQDITNTDKVAENEFQGIRIYNFMRFQKSLFDVYIQLSNHKFVKIINANENYELDILERYYAKGVGHLYLRSEDYYKFLEDLSTKSFLEEPLIGKNFLDTAKRNQKQLSAMIQGIGVDNYTLSLADDMSEQVLKEVDQNNDLKGLIEKLVNSNDYSYDHTFLTTCMTTAICRELNLDRNVIKKLSFASLLHDIGITDSALCKLHDLEPEKIQDLTKDEQRMIKSHHSLLDKVNFDNTLTQEVQEIQQYHHIYDANYLYQSIVPSKPVKPLVAIFMVAHEFSVQMYKHDFSQVHVMEMLNTVKLKYANKDFDKAIQALDRVVLVTEKS